MSRNLIGSSIEAGNTTNATIFQMPANNEGFISSIIAYNSTGGSLDLTLTITRAGVDVLVLALDSIGAGATAQYARGASKPVCPLTLLTGDTLKAKGSGAGIIVTISGIRYSLA